MKMKSFNELSSTKFLIIVCCVFVLVITSTYALLTPRDFERYMILTTLGENMTFTNYYGEENRNLKIDDTIQWHIEVYNRMGTAEYIAVRMKIINSTIPIDSSDGYIFESRHMLLHDSNYVFPIEWKISSIENEDKYIIIKQIVVNGEEISLNVRSLEGKNFRAIIELWYYNTDKDIFEQVEYDKKVINQIWFNIA